MTDYNGISISFGNKPVYDPANLYVQAVEKDDPTEHWYGKINCFHQPLGKEHGYGYLYMLQGDFANLNQLLLYSLEITNGDYTVSIDNLTIVSASAIYPSTELNNNTALIVTIADTRIFLQRTAINKGYNVYASGTSATSTTPEFDEDTTNAGDPWTWQEIVEDIWDHFPVGTAGSLDATSVTFPSYVPEGLCFYGITAWDALFICLEKINMVLSCQPNGTYKLYPEDGADDHDVGIYQAQYRSITDQTLNQTPSTITYPESVTVYFPNLSGYRPLYSVNILTFDINPLLTTRTGVVDILHDTTNAFYDTDDPPNVTNDTELDTVALDRVTQYITGLARPTDAIVCHELLGVHTNNLYDRVSWYDYGAGLYTEMVTRLQRRPSPPPCIDCTDPSTKDCTIVRFQIVSADPSARTGFGEITARPAGCGINDVPETSLGGTVIELCDPTGCFFAAPEEELTGRMGWAKYMQPVGEVVCQPGETNPVPQWEVFALCCAVITCSDDI